MKKKRLFSILVFILSLVFTAYFCYSVFHSQLLPQRLGVIVSFAFFLVLLLFSVLIFNKKSGFLVVLGGILALLYALAMLFASVYLNRAVSAAQTITTTKTEVATVNIYMLAEDVDESTELTADMRYGILEVQDRENTDIAIARLREEFGRDFTVVPYESTATMIGDLCERKLDAVIINSVFLEILSEMDGYYDIMSSLHEIRKTHVEHIVEVVETPSPQQTLRPLFPTATEKSTDEPEKEYPTTFAMYVSGIDSRIGLIEKSRSDVNILVVVNTDSHQILLITTPRDYYVPLPISNGIKDKLTHAGIYGVDVSKGTLEMLYDLDIDYYFRVNFSGFVDIVKAMGGVRVYNEIGFSSEAYYYPEGYNDLNGEKALDYVRYRKTIGDQQRGRNHMAFIKGVIEKATSRDILLKYSSILSAVEGCFETSMPYDVLSALVRDQIESGASWNITSYAVTGEAASRMTYSMSEYLFVFIPDESTVQAAKDMIRQVYNGEVPTLP